MKISVTIITRNEESNIEAAIKSVNWADEILVVDSESTDRTCEIASEMGARVMVRRWPGFAEQKQFAAENARHDWILSLDADERVSAPLRTEIEALLSKSSYPDAYRIPRRSFYMNRWIGGGGWYPDYQLRLYNRNKGRWQGPHVHESVEMSEGATIGLLRGDILHYSVSDAAHHHRMIGERYAPLGAKKMYQAGRTTSPVKIAVAGPSAFIRSYLLKGGFRDGVAGLAIAGFAAHHAFLKHLLLWELQHDRRDKV